MQPRTLLKCKVWEYFGYPFTNGSHVRNIFYKSNAKGSDRQSFPNDGFFGKNGIFHPNYSFFLILVFSELRCIPFGEEKQQSSPPRTGTFWNSQISVVTFYPFVLFFFAKGIFHPIWLLEFFWNIYSFRHPLQTKINTFYYKWCFFHLMVND